MISGVFIYILGCSAWRNTVNEFPVLRKLPNHHNSWIMEFLVHSKGATGFTSRTLMNIFV